jgi:hypothetical protein
LLGSFISAMGCTSATVPNKRSMAGSLCTVTADELRAVHTEVLHDALQELRPSLLRRNIRGELPMVVLDGVVISDPAMLLHSLITNQVYSVHRLNASAATVRYGLHQSNAVLEILTSPPQRSASGRGDSCDGSDH